MTQELQAALVTIGIGSIAVPWVVFVTKSLFNQKKELALLKQSHIEMKHLMNILVDLFKKKDTKTASQKKCSVVKKNKVPCDLSFTD